MNYVKLTIYPALEQVLDVLIDIDNEQPEKNLKPIIHKVSEILNKKNEFIFDVWSVLDVMHIAEQMDCDDLSSHEAIAILSCIESGCYKYRGINQSIVETHIESIYPERCVVKESD